MGRGRALYDLDSMRALDCAPRAIGTPHASVLGGHFQETLTAQRELSIAIGVGADAGFAVEVPDIEVICAQFLQTGVQAFERLLAGGGTGLAGERDAVARPPVPCREIALEQRATEDARDRIEIS